MDKNLPLNRAIQKLGSQQALADCLGIRSPSITEWHKRHRVPAGRCMAIEEATGGAVRRYDLRPDVFGPAPAQQDEVA